MKDIREMHGILFKFKATPTFSYPNFRENDVIVFVSCLYPHLCFLADTYLLTNSRFRCRDGEKDIEADSKTRCCGGVLGLVVVVVVLNRERREVCFTV